VQLLWLITVLVIVAAIATGPLALGSAKSDINTATVGLIPASAQLGNAARNFTAGSAGLVAAIQSSDPSARSAAINQLASYDTAANAAWNSYTRLRANLPGETKLRQVVEVDNQQLSTAGLAALYSTSDASAAVTAFTATASRQQQAVAALQQLYQTRINAVVTKADHSFSTHEQALVIVALVVLILVMVSFAMVTRSIRSRYRIQLGQVRRSDLESGLQRALEMVRTEPECYTLMQRAIERSEPGLRSEFLVADSSRAHFRQVIATGVGGGPGCSVMAPDDCPATNRGQTQNWPSSSDLDTCPHLADRETGPCSAVCVPVSIAGSCMRSDPTMIRPTPPPRRTWSSSPARPVSGSASSGRSAGPKPRLAPTR
jgi:hypothetical protein